MRETDEVSRYVEGKTETTEESFGGLSGGWVMILAWIRETTEGMEKHIDHPSKFQLHWHSIQRRSFAKALPVDQCAGAQRPNYQVPRTIPKQPWSLESVVQPTIIPRTVPLPEKLC